MASCTYMMVRGCLRCIDGVSRNIPRDDCRTSGAGATAGTVDQILAALPAGPVGPLGNGVWGNGVGLLGGLGGGRMYFHDAHTGEWIEDDQRAPAYIAPPPALLVAGTPPLTEVPVPALSQTTTSTLQPLPPAEPTPVPEPAMVCVWAALTIAMVMIHGRSLRGK